MPFPYRASALRRSPDETHIRPRLLISSIKARRDEGVSGVDADSTSEWAERDAEEEAEGPPPPRPPPGDEEEERDILPYCPDVGDECRGLRVGKGGE